MDWDKPFFIDTKTYPGIIRIVFQDDYDFTLADAKDTFDELAKAVNGKAMPVLKIPGKYSGIDSEARKFISSAEGMKYSLAEAFVTTFLPQRMIGNFYMKINKPVKPTAFFDTEEQAVAWLQKFVTN